MTARIRFGTFDADLAAGELYREGRLVPLQQQPFEVLRALVEHPGEVVTRETLRWRLWPDGTIVDFDQSLNKSLTKLRDALGDSASNPRFVQTLPKRGYRFIAPVTLPALPAREVAPATELQTPTLPVPASPPRSRALSWPWAWIVVILSTVGALALVVGLGMRGVPSARPPHAAGPSAQAPGFTPIAAARDAYERGLRALARGSEGCVRQSVALFQRAVDFSPGYAAAHAALAHAYLALAASGDEHAVRRARDAAARALAIDPALSAAFAALGRLALEHDRDWRLAEAHLSRAIALDPGRAEPRAWYAAALSEGGRDEEAEAEARRALAADPHALETNTTMGAVLYRAGRPVEAAAALERAVEIDPDYPPARRLLDELEQQGAISIQPIADMRR